MTMLDIEIIIGNRVLVEDDNQIDKKAMKVN